MALGTIDTHSEWHHAPRACDRTHRRSPLSLSIGSRKEICLEALVLLPQLEVSVHLARLGEHALNAVIKNLEDCTCHSTPAALPVRIVQCNDSAMVVHFIIKQSPLSIYINRSVQLGLHPGNSPKEAP